MPDNKPTHGGKRVGAGRPATLAGTSRHTVTLDQATLAVLRAISTNLSEAIRRLARQSKD